MNETIEEFPVFINIAHKHSLHVDSFIVMLEENIILNETLRIIPTRTAWIALLIVKKTRSASYVTYTFLSVRCRALPIVERY